MTKIPYEFNQKEKKERKLWLVTTIGLFLVLPIILFALSLLGIAFGKLQISRDIDIVSTLLGNIIGGSVGLWVIWHCAYKKHGIKLLIAFLMLGAVNILCSIIKAFTMSSDAWVIGGIIFDSVIYIWWLILSVKLLRINEKIQYELPCKIQIQYLEQKSVGNAAHTDNKNNEETQMV